MDSRAPTTACSSCGVTKWKRISSEGTWICIHGHQYQGNEEIGDHEAIVGTQARIIKSRKEKKRKKSSLGKARKIKLSHHLVLLHFQCRLKEQMEWLMEEEDVDAAALDIVLNLWALFVQSKTSSSSSSEIPLEKVDAKDNSSNVNIKNDQQALAGGPETAAEGVIENTQDQRLASLCSTLRPCFSLVFLSLALFIVKAPITLGDLIRFACSTPPASTPFPYFFFKGRVTKYTAHTTASGGYSAIPSFSLLNEYYTMVVFAILNKKNNDDLKDGTDNFQLSFSLSQPHLVLRLFKDLELPCEMYLFYKTISSIYGCRLAINENPTISVLHVSTCCLWIARLYHFYQEKETLSEEEGREEQEGYPSAPPPLAPNKSPASFLFMDSQVSSEIYLPLLSNHFPHIPQKKGDGSATESRYRKRDSQRGIASSKIVESLFQNIVLKSSDQQEGNGGRGLLFLHGGVQESAQKFQSRLRADAITCSATSSSSSSRSSPWLVKSYLNSYTNDVAGAKETRYVSLVLKTAGCMGIEAERLEKEVRTLDLILYYYSMSCRKNEENSARQHL